MIELRWVKRITERGGTAGGPDEWFKKAPVLQYRQQVITVGNGYRVSGPDGTIHEYQRPMGYTWSEWADVPTDESA